MTDATQKPALWTRNFVTVAAANFLLFFSFYQLLPILPLYIIEKFQTDNATAGFIISLYTIGVFSAILSQYFLWTFFSNLKNEVSLSTIASVRGLKLPTKSL